MASVTHPGADSPFSFRYLAWLPLLVGSVTMAGHILAVDILTRLHPAFFPMRGSVSLALILLGVALLPAPQSGSPRRRIFAFATLMLGVLGLIVRYMVWTSALEGFGGMPLWITWLQMSSLTSICLLCCSAAILLVDTRDPVPDRAAAALLLSCLAACVCAMSMLADFFPLARVGSAFTARMAIHTAATLALGSISMAWSIWRTLVRDLALAPRLAVAVLVAAVAVCFMVWRVVLANRAAFVIAEASTEALSIAQLFNQQAQAQKERLTTLAELARRAGFDANLLADSGITVVHTSDSDARVLQGCTGSSAGEAFSRLAVQAERSTRTVLSRIDCGPAGPLILWGASVRPGTVLLVQRPFRRLLENAAAPVAGSSYAIAFRPRSGDDIAIRRGRRPFAANALVDTEVTLAGVNGTLRTYIDRESIRGNLSWIAELGVLGGLAGAFILSMGVYLGVAAHLRYRSMFAAQIALSRQAQQLLVSNAHLQQFAYVASHDLQEPLRIVVTYSQLLHRRFGEKLGPDGERFLGFLETASQRMSSLIGDLLAYSRVVNAGDVPTAPVDMNVVLRIALDNLSVAIQETGARIDTLGPLPSVLGYQVHLVQVMQNLISNALKYRGGQAPKVEIGAERDNGSWTFRVRDNGIGIKPEYHERIFAIFRRLHSAAVPGTGIGLALCKAIVEQHGGEIWVQSEPGAGSTFFFRLPAKE